MLPKTDPSKTDSWKKLKEHHSDLQGQHLRDWFINNPLRFKEFSLTFKDVLFDFSKNLIGKDTIEYLAELCEECKMAQSISSYFNGDAINETENRAVLHTALRNFSDKPILYKGKDVMPDILKVREQMKNFSEKIINGEWLGYTEKPITDIVNIGIGGSDLGPKMVYEALRPYHRPNIKCYYVSNIDGAHLSETIKNLDRETTLFIIASKTFTTQETMTNAHSARNWFLQSGEEGDIAKHFVAVSTNKAGVVEFGIHPANMFVFWDWTGGRYSLWSAIGLSLCCGLGYASFEKLLKGANAMDEHFRTTPLKSNIPVLMGMIGVWYTNFWNAGSEAILPYDQNMHRFAAYFQQGNMESNGKSVDRNGERVQYSTGPVIWGEPGTNGQHAFFQLLHQGTQMIPCDFIAFANSHYELGDHHEKLLSNFFAQPEALMKGKTLQEVLSEHELSANSRDITPHLAHKVFEGNKPSTSILAPLLDEFTLGLLISCYEHKIFVQGVIWNIFSFDQWGVELGKQLAKRILPDLQHEEQVYDHDNSTNGLINHYKKMRLKTDFPN